MNTKGEDFAGTFDGWVSGVKFYLLVPELPVFLKFVG
jgi:hypothetical protein